MAREVPLAWWLFGGVVMLPTALSGGYFACLASDVYVSESRFVVHAADRLEGGGGLSNLFRGIGAPGSEDTLVLRDYLLSREVMHDADREYGLRTGYGRGDLLSRFPAPWEQDRYEDFVDYYQRQVQVNIDPQSTVGVLTVRGFDSKQVQDWNRALLGKAARRIGELNESMRRDTLALAQAELQKAERRLRQAEAQVAGFRMQAQVLDPERQAGLELQSMQELRHRLVGAESRLAQLRALAPQSPQVAALQSEIGTLKDALAQAQARVTGPGGSRAHAAQTYAGLQLERELAAKLVAAATEALTRASVQAQRRHLYLETLSAPSLPDAALQPRRWRNVLATFVFGLLAWGVLGLLLSGVREHHDGA